MTNGTSNFDVPNQPPATLSGSVVPHLVAPRALARPLPPRHSHVARTAVQPPGVGFAGRRGGRAPRRARAAGPQAGAPLLVRRPDCCQRRRQPRLVRQDQRRGVRGVARAHHARGVRAALRARRRGRGKGKRGRSAAKKSTRVGFLFPSCAGAPLRGATGMRAGAEAPPRHASRPSRGALCPPRARGARRARREEMQKHQRRAWPPAPPPLARGGSGRAMALRPWPRMVHVLDICEAGVREVAAARAARRQRA